MPRPAHLGLSVIALGLTGLSQTQAQDRPDACTATPEGTYTAVCLAAIDAAHRADIAARREWAVTQMAAICDSVGPQLPTGWFAVPRRSGDDMTCEVSGTFTDLPSPVVIGDASGLTDGTFVVVGGSSSFQSVQSLMDSLQGAGIEFVVDPFWQDGVMMGQLAARIEQSGNTLAITPVWDRTRDLQAALDYLNQRQIGITAETLADPALRWQMQLQEATR